MVRKHILEFICTNFPFFSSCDFIEMTICLYGKKYKDNLYSKLSLGDDMFIYNVKLPRIYSKVVSLDKMNNGILEFVNTIDDVKVYKQSDFLFDIFEPYKETQIKNLKFNYLYLVPIIKDGLREGSLLIYGDQECDCKFSKSSLNNLVNGLTNVDIETFNNAIDKALFTKEELSFVVGKKEQNIPFGFATPLSKADVDKFINQSNTVCKNLSYPFEDYTLYYHEKKVERLFISKSQIDLLSLKEEFTLLYFYFNELLFKKSLKEYLNSFNLSFNYDIVELDNNYYLLVINEVVNLRTLCVSLSSKNCYYLMINNKHFSHLGSLAKLSLYVLEKHPESFDKEQYLEFIENYGNDVLKVEKNTLLDSVLVNSKTLKEVSFVNSYLRKIYYDDNLKKYEKKALNALSRKLKEDGRQELGAFIFSSSLKNKFLKEILRKAERNNISIYLIISSNHQDVKSFIKDLSEVKKIRSSKVIVDSSVSFNLEYDLSMKLVDGCYFNKLETQNVYHNDLGLGSILANYFFNNGKFIVFTKDDKEKNKMYEDELVYFILEREKK